MTAPVKIIQGTVTTVSPLTVTTDGATVAVPAEQLASYDPTIADRVACVRLGPYLLVLGLIGPFSGGGGGGGTNVVTGAVGDPTGTSITSTTAGAGSSSSGAYSGPIAVGEASLANAPAAVALGYHAQVPTVSGDSAVAVGYFSEADNSSGVAVGDHSHAQGQSSVAIGDRAQTQADEAIAIGTLADAQATGSIAIGFDTSGAVAAGQWDIAIGGGSSADSSSSVGSDESSVAIGDFAQANARAAVLLGSQAFIGFSGHYSVAVGQYAQADQENCVAIGAGAQASTGSLDTGTVVVGSGASAGSGIAVGRASDGTTTSNLGRDGIAIGGGAINNNINGIAMGTGASSTGGGAIAIGCDDGGSPATAEVENAIALGGRSDARGDSAVAIGHSADAKSDWDIAIGSAASTRGPGTGTIDGSIAIGEQAAAGEATPPGGANFSIAIGGSAVAMAEGAIRIGVASTGSNQAGRYATIIGSNAFGPHASAVALGSNTAASADGAVAIGTDHTGAGASAAGTDDFVLGTGNHKYHFPGSAVGFFGVTPAVQAAHPTTLADVITILQNLGVCL